MSLSLNSCDAHMLQFVNLARSFVQKVFEESKKFDFNKQRH